VLIPSLGLSSLTTSAPLAIEMKIRGGVHRWQPGRNDAYGLNIQTKSEETMESTETSEVDCVLSLRAEITSSAAR